jgi:branched-subunit amino acid transport protein AzlD
MVTALPGMVKLLSVMVTGGAEVQPAKVKPLLVPGFNVTLLPSVRIPDAVWLMGFGAPAGLLAIVIIDCCGAGAQLAVMVTALLGMVKLLSVIVTSGVEDQPAKVKPSLVPGFNVRVLFSVRVPDAVWLTGFGMPAGLLAMVSINCCWDSMFHTQVSVLARGVRRCAHKLADVSVLPVYILRHKPPFAADTAGMELVPRLTKFGP